MLKYKKNTENTMIKVLVDTLGGDRSPDANLEGALLALEKIDDLEIILVGDKGVIEEKLAGKKYDAERVTIEHAPDTIECNDKPTDAIRTKKQSSLYRCIELL